MMMYALTSSICTSSEGKKDKKVTFFPAPSFPSPKIFPGKPALTLAPLLLPLLVCG